jgi:poly(A) polymerase
MQEDSNLVLEMKLFPTPNILNEFTNAVSDIAAEIGVKAYLVGGGLRDALMGRELSDFDFALSGAEEELPRTFAAKIEGSFFWLDKRRLQSRVVIKHEGKTATFDFAPMRGRDITEDLALRDFTINALALPLLPEGSSILDPFAGIPDIRQGIIRVCSGLSFESDPLRLLRALRFEAVFGFTIEPGTWLEIRGKAPLLQNVASERVRDELFRILASSNAGVSLGRLHESGLLAEMLPSSLLSSQAIAKRINRVSDVELILQGFDRFFPGNDKKLLGYLSGELQSGVKLSSLVKLAAFVGRCGDGTVFVTELAGRLKLGCKARKVLEILVRDTEPVIASPGLSLTKRALYRFFKDIEPAGSAVLIAAFARKLLPLEICQTMFHYYFDEYEDERVETLLSGEEIMGILGTGPGRAVGEAMKRLRHAERVGLVSSKAEAREYIGKNLLTKDEAVS